MGRLFNFEGMSMKKKVPDGIAAMIRIAVTHAVQACANATGQHRTIAHFVNKTQIANEVIDAIEEAQAEQKPDTSASVT